MSPFTVDFPLMGCPKTNVSAENGLPFCVSGATTAMERRLVMTISVWLRLREITGDLRPRHSQREMAGCLLSPTLPYSTHFYIRLCYSKPSVFSVRD